MRRLTLSKLHPQLGIAVLALSACLLLTGFLGRHLYVEREATIDTARDRIQELAQLLEEHARQNLQRVEFTLLMAVGAVNDHRKSGSTDLQGLQRRLRALLPKDSMLRALTVIDPNGRTLLSTQSLDTKGMPDMSGRDFFTAQRGQAGLGMFAGTPALAGQAGLWTLPVSMRLAADDGTFHGVLLAEVDAGVIGRYYASIDTGAKGFVTLFQRSGWIVVRAPHSEAILSRNWAESPMFR